MAMAMAMAMSVPSLVALAATIAAGGEQTAVTPAMGPAQLRVGKASPANTNATTVFSAPAIALYARNARSPPSALPATR
jgi:hypothetical protein